MRIISEKVKSNQKNIVLVVTVEHRNVKRTVEYRYGFHSVVYPLCEIAVVEHNKSAVTMTYQFFAGILYIAKYGKDTDKRVWLKSHIANLRAIWTNELFDQIFMKVNLKKRFGLLSVLYSGV